MRISTTRSKGPQLLTPLAGLALLASTSPAWAQAEGQETPGSTEPVCELQAVETAEGAPRELHALCGERGFVLGPVSEFSVISNQALKAVLVDVDFQGTRRVLLLSVGENGMPMAENLTGQIALAAGKGPMSEIDDVTVELADFASAGTIAVESKAEGQAEAGTKEIGLGEQLAASRAGLGGSTE